MRNSELKIKREKKILIFLLNIKINKLLKTLLQKNY
jgi:hypothetical protein